MNDKKKKIKTSNIALLVVATILILFTIAMISVFVIKGNVPDSLIVAVFSCCGFEVGALGWIKTNKIKYNQDQDDEEYYSRRAE